MAIFRQIISVPNGATSKVINHGLGNSAAVLSACTPGGWNGRPYITARDANNITVRFGLQAPGSGALTIDAEVNTDGASVDGFPGALPPGATTAEIQAALDNEELTEVILPSGVTVQTASLIIRRSNLWFHGHADGTSKLVAEDNLVSDDTSHQIIIGLNSTTRIENVRISHLTIEHDRVASPDMRCCAIDLWRPTDNLEIDHITGLNLTSDFFIGRPFPWNAVSCIGLKIHDIEIYEIWEGVVNIHSAHFQDVRCWNVHATATNQHAGYQGPMLFELNIEQTVGSVTDAEFSNSSMVLTGAALQGAGSLGITLASNDPRGACWYDKISIRNCVINGAYYGAYFPAQNYSTGVLTDQKSLVTLIDCQLINCIAPYYVFPHAAELTAPKIVSNRCVRGAAASPAAWDTSYAADQEAYCKITNPTDFSLQIRLQDKNIASSEQYQLYFASTTIAQVWVLRDPGHGIEAVQIGADIAITQSADDEWKIRAITEVDDSVTLTVYKNGSLVATRNDTSEHAVLGAGYLGQILNGATTSIIDFGGGAVSTTALLDSMTRANEDPIDPANWVMNGGWRTGSAEDRIIFARGTGNTNVPIEDQTGLGIHGEIVIVDAGENDWT